MHRTKNDILTIVGPHRTKKIIALYAAFIFAVVAASGSSLKRESDLDISSLSLDELLQVEISTPAKIPETIQNTPANVYIVSRKDIERQGYSSITDIFENIPGAYNIYNYHGISGNFGLRGYWNGRSQNSSIAFLVNGIPQSRMDTRSTPMDSLNMPVEAIDRIEIIKGPNSVIYGNGAFFGAVNIITNDFFHQDQVSFTAGSNQTTRSAVRWSTQTDNFNLIINAGHYKSNDLNPTLGDLMSGKNIPSAFAPFIPPLETSLEDRLEKQTKNVSVSGDWKNFYFDYSHYESDIEFYFFLPPVADGTISSKSNSRTTIGYKDELTPSLSWNTWVSHNDFESKRRYDAIFPEIVANNNLDYQSWELESVFGYTPSDAFHLTVGLTWKRLQDLFEYTHIPVVGVENEIVKIEKRDTQAAFAQANYQLSEKFRIIGGVRLEELKTYTRSVYGDNIPNIDRIQGDLKNTTPRVSLIYQISDNQQLKLMAGDAAKMPNAQDDRFSSEEVRTLELMYTIGNKDALFTVSVFENNLSDLLIEALTITERGSLSTNANAGNMLDTKGFEALLQQRIGDKWRSEIALTYQDSDDKTHPNRNPIYSPQIVAHGKLVYENENFSGALLGRFVDRITPYYDAESDLPSGDISGSYAVFDASLRWNKIWKDLYVSIKVSNVFDKTVRYPLNPINSSILDKGTLGDGRGFQVTSGFKF